MKYGLLTTIKRISLAALTTAILAPMATVAASSPAAGVIKIDNLPGPSSAGDVIQRGISTLLTVVGIVAVIMVVIGGFMYVLSAGDSSKAAKAKDTILYAVVGVVITLLAYSIINFVLLKVK